MWSSSALMESHKKSLLFQRHSDQLSFVSESLTKLSSWFNNISTIYLCHCFQCVVRQYGRLTLLHHRKKPGMYWCDGSLCLNAKKKLKMLFLCFPKQLKIFINKSFLLSVESKQYVGALWSMYGVFLHCVKQYLRMQCRADVLRFWESAVCFITGIQLNWIRTWPWLKRLDWTDSIFLHINVACLNLFTALTSLFAVVILWLYCAKLTWTPININSY